MTTLRSHFDCWLAGKATEAGARLLTSTVATGLVRDADGRVVGVRTDRDGAELRAQVVIACDGVNSFLAKEAGLMARAEASHHTLGVKEVLDLAPRSRSTSGSGSGGTRVSTSRCSAAPAGIPGGGFPLHQRRHGERRRGPVPPPAGRVGGPARGAGGRPQGASRPSPPTCGAPPCASTRPTSSPRAGYDTMPAAGRRRHGRRRRRRGHDPGRRPVAGGRQLRHRFGIRRRPGG